jgi:predicted transcriptional regulator of viral defense system
VTPRKPAVFENPFGAFRYRHIKPSAFFGYHAIDLSGAKVLMAEPEKALLDFWHLEPGIWTAARMVEMRFQNMEQIDIGRLRAYAGRFKSPRLTQAVAVWEQIRNLETEGTREL